MTSILDVAAVQHALDALITGDNEAAAGRLTDDVVLTGVGGCLNGRTAGLPAVIDRFADMSRLTSGTFGTEVEAVYTGNTTELAVVTRHWALLDGKDVHGTQVLLITADGGRIRTINTLSRAGATSGIWD